MSLNGQISRLLSLHSVKINFSIELSCLVSTITLKFILHRGFVSPGTYEVYVGGMKAVILVSRERNSHSLEKIFPRFSPVNPSDAYDIHGIVNISRISMTLTTPFKFEDNPRVAEDLKRECLKYLNRLVEVIRYKTRKYWLLPVSEYEVLYADIQDLTDVSLKKKQGYLEMSYVTAAVNLPIKEESEVIDEIKHLLKNGEKLPYSEALILDAYSYIFTGQFNESIVMSNLALEIFILESLREILQLIYSTDEEIDGALERVTKGKLHATFRKNFLGGKDHNELIETNDIYRKFDEARNYRSQIMHHGKRLNMHDAEVNLRDILHINFYLLENISAYAERIIQRSQKNVKKELEGGRRA